MRRLFLSIVPASDQAPFRVLSSGFSSRALCRNALKDMGDICHVARLLHGGSAFFSM
jgi:hypothetical protein